MSQLIALKTAMTLSDVADLLQLKPRTLSYLLYKLPDVRKYKRFEIPKRSGGMRPICAPHNELKLVQRRVSDLLQNCIEEINKASNRNDDGDNPDRIAHAFKRKRSIITNARQHKNKRYVFNVDLEDFFGTINFGRVRGFFIADRNFQLQPPVATVLAQIACFENALPQGSPCSPVLSNLIAHILDIHLVKLAEKSSCIYTRYADDITFSTNKKKFPSEVAIKDYRNEHLWHCGSELERIIQKSGYKINLNKVRMQYNNFRQEVTGLIVNRKVNVKQEYRHITRAMVHSLITKGSFDVDSYVVDENGKGAIQKISGESSLLQGRLSFIDAVDYHNHKHEKREKNSLLVRKESLYKKFLLFNDFYNSSTPVVICEGKTDNIYITHAIRRLADQYPQLAHKDGAIIRIIIRRYNYSSKSKSRILGMSGGTGELNKFILSYRDITSKFTAPGLRCPVILLVDNDSGATPIINGVKDIAHKKVIRTDNFIHLFKNLYLVLTPLGVGGTQSTIEDFFGKAVRGEVLNGKVFHPEEEGFDQRKHYGKDIFARYVVASKADSIDFDGFRPILDRFVLVLNEHARLFP